AVAPSLGMQVTPILATSPDEIDHGLNAFAAGGGGGVIALSGPLIANLRERIMALSARYRLPAIYPYRFYAADGGLMPYGPDIIDQYRRSASYAGRILKGEKPGDLPVQAPTIYELVINLKTARAMGLTIPASFLTRADEVIE